MSCLKQQTVRYFASLAYDLTNLIGWIRSGDHASDDQKSMVGTELHNVHHFVDAEAIAVHFVVDQ